MTTKKTGPLAAVTGWPRRKLRAFISWAMWSRQRFVAVLVGAVAIVALAVTIAVTTVAVTVQGAVNTAGVSASNSSATTEATSYPSGYTLEPMTEQEWVAHDSHVVRTPTAIPTATLTMPPYAAGAEAATRYFAQHWLDGANRSQGSLERERWVRELAALCLTPESCQPRLKDTPDGFIPTATITRAVTTERYKGLGSGGTLTTFDLSNGTALVVEVRRVPGGDAPWQVYTWWYQQ